MIDLTFPRDYCELIPTNLTQKRRPCWVVTSISNAPDSGTDAQIRFVFNHHCQNTDSFDQSLTWRAYYMGIDVYLFIASAKRGCLTVPVSERRLKGCKEPVHAVNSRISDERWQIQVILFFLDQLYFRYPWWC